jgi:2-phospho-L-lactate guanylyltransferase
MRRATGRWTVLVPMRMLSAAKSRLAADIPAGLHAELVRAIRADSLAAITAAAPVARTVVVTDDPDPTGLGATHVLVQRSPGLNGALRDGARQARVRWPADGVAAVVGDLPALRAEELAAALDAASGRQAGYVPDASGTGTTLLTAAPGHRLDPHFGPGSAARHSRGAVQLAAGAGLRQDVDTLADLIAARQLGLGPDTAAILGAVDLIRSCPAAHVEGA